MPELPEVETIRSGLSDRIVKKTICQVEVLNRKSFVGKKASVLGQRVVSVKRRAKILQLKLNHEESLLFHLKMTGQLILSDKAARFAGGHPSLDWLDDLPNKHTRITFTFDDGSRLFFNDLRKFGWCKALSEAETVDEFTKYGPEPFSQKLNPSYLYQKAIKRKSITVKQFLLDQSVVAGIGNIYNDESLFQAKISPKAKAKNLNLADWQKIIKSIRSVLRKGIKYGGTTDSDYVNSEGKSGQMQDYLKVYHQTGNNCPNACGETIQRIKIGGRGTYYCPSCQKETA